MQLSPACANAGSASPMGQVATCRCIRDEPTTTMPHAWVYQARAAWAMLCAAWWFCMRCVPGRCADHRSTGDSRVGAAKGLKHACQCGRWDTEQKVEATCNATVRVTLRPVVRATGERHQRPHERLAAHTLATPEKKESTVLFNCVFCCWQCSETLEAVLEIQKYACQQRAVARPLRARSRGFPRASC